MCSDLVNKDLHFTSPSWLQQVIVFAAPVLLGLVASLILFAPIESNILRLGLLLFIATLVAVLSFAIHRAVGVKANLALAQQELITVQRAQQQVLLVNKNYADLLTELLPLWQRQTELARAQMEQSVSALVTRFVEINERFVVVIAANAGSSCRTQ